MKFTSLQRLLSIFISKKQKFEGRLGEWIAKVEIPEAMSQMANSFDENGEFSDSVDERFYAIKQAFSEKSARSTPSLKAHLLKAHHALSSRYPDALYQLARGTFGARRL